MGIRKTSRELRYRGLFAVGICLLLASNLVYANDHITSAPTPDWVEQHTPDFRKNYQADEVNNGQFFLLVERQTMVHRLSDERYVHYAISIVNEKGLEASSQLKVNFDPSYETVQLHRVQVHRGPQHVDQLDLDKVKVVQREEELEYQLYDGRQTLLYLFEDLRVGDVVEYSYTVSGRNPAMGAIYAGTYDLQWSVPVGELYLRIISDGRKIYHRVKNSPGLEVKKRTGAGRIEYVIHRQDLEPIYQDSKQPAWYHGYPVIELSSIELWRDVADWAVEIYAPKSEVTQQFVDIVKRLQRSGITQEEQVLSAVRFVQDEIRYLGIELGAGSYVPSTSQTTLARRFGDCKDKSVLLVDLLSALGVRAYPVLVDTEYGQDLKNVIPSPKVFDHVVVLIELDGNEYWVDPTMTLVGGRLENRIASNLSYGLPIRKGATLKKVPVSEYSQPLVSVSETFDLTMGVNAPARFDVVTIFRSVDADYNRERLAQRGAAEVAKTNLEYYRKYYPTLELASDMQISDDRELNELTLTESYVINKHWEHNDESHKQESNYYTTEVRPYLKKPVSLTRTGPYALAYPVYISQLTRIHLAGDWDISPEDISIANDYFRFTKHLSFKDNVVDLAFSYKSLKDHVPPSAMESYAKDVRQASALLGLGLYSGSDDANQESMDIKAWMLIGYLGFLALVLIVTVIITFKPRNIDENEDVYFHPISALKFVLLNIFTMGLYSVYWFAKGWRYLKNNEGLSVMPIMRGIFSIFFYTAFFKHLKRYAVKNGLAYQGPTDRQIYSLHAGYVALHLLGPLSGVYGLLSLAAFLFLLPMVSLITEINTGNRQALRAYASLGLRHYMAMFLGAHLLVSLVLGELNFIPPNMVIAGERLPSYEMKFLQRVGVMDPGEKLELFYSDGFWSYRTDGNGLTDRRVFSYWKGSDDTRTNIKFAYFDQIDDIDVRYADSSLDNTIVTVIRKDGEKLYLYLSVEKRQDREFVKLLRKRISL